MAATPTPFLWTLREGRTITFSSLLCAALRSEVGALKVELDAGVVWDHWIGWGMTRAGVSGCMMYYKTTKECKYYLLHCWRCLDMNETLLGADASKLDCKIR